MTMRTLDIDENDNKKGNVTIKAMLWAMISNKSRNDMVLVEENKYDLFISIREFHDD